MNLTSPTPLISVLVIWWGDDERLGKGSYQKCVPTFSLYGLKDLSGEDVS